jgi:hypothetical protein
MCPLPLTISTNFCKLHKITQKQASLYQLNNHQLLKDTLYHGVA